MVKTIVGFFVGMLMTGYSIGQDSLITVVPEKSVEKESVLSSDSAYSIVEVMPEYPGGRAQFFYDLSVQLIYPISAKILKIQGKVHVQFVVDEKGKMREIKVIKGIGAGCDEEALRAFNEVAKQAKWKPGYHKGLPVKVKMVYPVTFALPKEQSESAWFGYPRKND